MTLFLVKVISNVALALVSMLVGVIATAAIMRRRSRVASTSSPPPAETPDSERTSRAIDAIRQLAQDVAADVGDHNVAIQGWSKQLDESRSSGESQAHEIDRLIAGMLEANQRLHKRLEDAERKIATQADEIRAQQSDARTDVLTSLPNRRAFDAEMAALVGRAAESCAPYSLIIFDIDHFKHFNDAHGHLAGDEVLRTVARTLTSEIRSPNMAARYGGEEFAIILPGTSLAAAQQAAERVRTAIERTTVVYDGKLLSVTASLGLAGLSSKDQQSTFIRRADEAVYAAKEAGRNCCFWHDGQAAQRVTQTRRPSVVSGASKCSKAAQVSSAAICASSLPNEAQFIAAITSYNEERRPSGQPLALLYLQIFEFPLLSDSTLESSRAVLCDHVASSICGIFRDHDAIGRLGEGGFIVALPGSSESAARIIAQRIRAAIASQPFSTEDGVIHLQVIMGVAALTGNGLIEESINAAREIAQGERECASNLVSAGS